LTLIGESDRDNVFAIASTAATEVDIMKTFGFGFLENAPEINVIELPLLRDFAPHLLTLNFPQKLISTKASI